MAAAAASSARPQLPAPRVRNYAARRIVDELLRDPASFYFKVLPDPYIYPDYYAQIARPVTIADMHAAACGPAGYSLQDIQADLRRMVSNAKKFNKAESDVYQHALRLEVRSAADAAHICLLAS